MKVEGGGEDGGEGEGGGRRGKVKVEGGREDGGRRGRRWGR